MRVCVVLEYVCWACSRVGLRGFGFGTLCASSPVVVVGFGFVVVLAFAVLLFGVLFVVIWCLVVAGSVVACWFRVVWVGVV